MYRAVWKILKKGKFSMLFPNVIAAARTLAGGQWALGDALIKDCGPPGNDGVRNASSIKIAAAAEELFKQGLMSETGNPYSPSTLRDYRDTAAQFSPGERSPGVAFSVHCKEMAEEMEEKRAA